MFYIYIRRITDHNIKAVLNPKHPLRVEESGGGVLVIGIPKGKLFGDIGGEAVFFQQRG